MIGHIEEGARRSSFAPTVLIVDDDVMVTQRWAREFHQRTSLGVVIANTLADAARIVESKEASFDAVVADLYFQAAAIDAKRRIGDGVDLLEWLSKNGVDVPTFVISASSEMVDYKRRIESSALSVEKYFDKFSSAGTMPAWIDIQRSVLRRKFGTDSAVASYLDSTIGADGPVGIDFVNDMLSRLQLSVRTYLQQLPSDSAYNVAKPIEAICVAEDVGVVRAYAPALGLLAGAQGETVEDALRALGEQISVEADVLLKEPAGVLSAYAQRVADRLGEFLRKRE